MTFKFGCALKRLWDTLTRNVNHNMVDYRSLLLAIGLGAIPASAIDTSTRYILTPMPGQISERASINDFGQVAYSNTLWTPDRPNGVNAATGFTTTLSQVTTISELTANGQVIGSRRPTSSASPDDAYLRIWTPSVNNGTSGTFATTNVLGQMRAATTDVGDYLWGVRTLAAPYDIRIERWTPNQSGSFDRTPLNVSVPLSSYVFGLGSTGDRFYVSVNSAMFPSPNGIDRLSVYSLATGAQTVLREGTTPQNAGYAAGMNTSGVLVGGTKQNTSTNSIPLAWYPEGTGYREVTLAPASQDARGQAFGVNDRGDIVGWSGTLTNADSALWENNGSTVSLLKDHLETHTSVGYKLGYAMAINSLGQIVSRSSYDPDGDPNTSPAYQNVLLTPARLGDADVDQDVDFDDLLTLAQQYGEAAGATWFTGDFTGDGAVNFDDLLVLAQQYGYGTSLANFDDDTRSATFTADLAFARFLAPEPTLLSCTAFLCMFARRARQEVA